MKINFCKMHSNGNDFIIIDNTLKHYDLPCVDIKLLCDRHYGIGCDQLLFVQRQDDYFNWYIYNSNGNEVEQCLNGARCLIWYIAKNYNLQQVTLLNKNDRKMIGSIKNNLISLNVGKVSFLLKDAYCTLEYRADNKYHLFDVDFSVASIANPHIVIEVVDFTSRDDYERIAKLFQQSVVFRNSVNVNFYSFNHNKLSVLTYERDCGFTLSCGSGIVCTAACVQYGKQLLVNDSINVKYDNDLNSIITSDVTLVYTGVFYA